MLSVDSLPMGSMLRTAAHRLRNAAAALNPNVPQTFPPGHFYSPVSDVREIRSRHEALFNRSVEALPGIDCRPDEQLALLGSFAGYLSEMPFADEPTGELRYGFNNPYFSYGDGLALYCMLRHFSPKRVLEVGSGWSSALMLDVNERFLGGDCALTFIEPYPERLNSLLRPTDRDRATILTADVQDIHAEAFAELAAGDLLLIDSTHVSSAGSDVNRLLLDVIPRLPPGVVVHVHDVFWPFEYPERWVYAGRGWNEDYLLRALLVNNSRLSITWFNSYMAQFHYSRLDEASPLWMRNPGGSIYLTTQ